jgi:hypothetical protein
MESTRAIMLGFFPRNGHLPLPPHFIILDLTHAVVLSICACFMLQGANWARIAFYIIAALNVIDSIEFGLGFEMATAIAKLVIAGLILATRRSNRFFAGKDPNFKKWKPADIPVAPRQREGRYDY